MEGAIVGGLASGVAHSVSVEPNRGYRPDSSCLGSILINEAHGVEGYECSPTLTRSHELVRHSAVRVVGRSRGASRCVSSERP